MTDQEKLVHNESQKLKAAFLNNMSVASFIGATIGPALTYSRDGEVIKAIVILIIGALLSALFRAAAERAITKLQV